MPLAYSSGVNYSDSKRSLDLDKNESVTGYVTMLDTWPVDRGLRARRSRAKS